MGIRNGTFIMMVPRMLNHVDKKQTTFKMLQSTLESKFYKSQQDKRLAKETKIHSRAIQNPATQETTMKPGLLQCMT